MTPGKMLPHISDNFRDRVIGQPEAEQWTKLFWGKVPETVYLKPSQEELPLVVIITDELSTNLMEITQIAPFPPISILRWDKKCISDEGKWKKIKKTFRLLTKLKASIRPKNKDCFSKGWEGDLSQEISLMKGRGKGWNSQVGYDVLVHRIKKKGETIFKAWRSNISFPPLINQQPPGTNINAAAGVHYLWFKVFNKRVASLPSQRKLRWDQTNLSSELFSGNLNPGGNRGKRGDLRDFHEVGG